MDHLAIYFIILASICTKDAWSITLGHESIKTADVENRIRGGTEATIEEKPYTAFLKPQGGGPVICAGAIINEYYIVTAAQCVANSKSVDIRVGSADRTEGGLQYTSSIFFIHPMYIAGEYDYDVAVVVIEDGMMLDGETVDAIELVALNNDPTPDYIEVYFAGWGKVGPKLFDEVSTTLRAGELELMNRDECAEMIPGITDRLFCGIDGRHKTDAACMGDLGGPVVDIDYLLAGVISRTTACDPAKPQPMTRLGHPQIRTFLLPWRA